MTRPTLQELKQEVEKRRQFDEMMKRHRGDKQELCVHIISEIDQLANMLEKNDTIILDDLLARLKSYKQDLQEA